MSDQDLRFEPMTTGMVLDKTFRIYVQNFGLMIGMTAIVHIPILILTVGVPFINQLSSAIAVIGLLLGAFAAMASSLIVGPLVTGATTKAVSDRYLGNPVTAKEALKTAWGSVGTLLLTQIIVGIIVFVGFSSYRPGNPLDAFLRGSGSRGDPRKHLRSAGDPPAKLGTGKGQPREGFRDHGGDRHHATASGRRGRFVHFLVFDAGSTGAVAMAQIIGGIAGMLTYPLQAIAVTLLYYDFRIRKEGFDLEMLSQAMGNPPVRT